MVRGEPIYQATGIEAVILKFFPVRATAYKVLRTAAMVRDIDPRVAANADLRPSAQVEFRLSARANVAKRCVRQRYLIGIRSLAIRISMGYVLLMIRNFKGKFAEPILQGRIVPKGFPANLAKVARRKLIMVDAAAFLEALNSPPGNRLEALKAI